MPRYSFFDFDFEILMKYPPIIKNIYIPYMKDNLPLVRHPSHPRRGQGFSTSHMNQFEQSDWLMLAHFFNSMIEYIAKASGVRRIPGKVSRINVIQNLYFMLILYVYSRKSLCWFVGTLEKHCPRVSEVTPKHGSRTEWLQTTMEKKQVQAVCKNHKMRCIWS